jgi:fucose 4-O-acetylase-like acetyltransferase
MYNTSVKLSSIITRYYNQTKTDLSDLRIMALTNLQPTLIQRDHLLDNLKFILISFVVIGHFIQPYIEQSVTLKTVFFCIYSFHMPLFVFISGYFSKSQNSLNPGKIVATILIPYIIFSIIWCLRESIHTKHLSLNIFVPPFHLWYLLSLFTWKALLPYIQALRAPIFFLVVLALITGFSHAIGWHLSLSRTISLLPFFVLGSLCSSSILYKIHNMKYFLLLGVILLVVLACCISQFPLFNWAIFFWSPSYHEAGYSNGVGFGLRFTAMFLAFGIGLALLALTPVKKVFFTSLGSRTMLVFILHGFLVPTFTTRFPLWNQSLLNNFIILIFPVLLIYLLSQPILEKFYQKIMNIISSRVMVVYKL